MSRRWVLRRVAADERNEVAVREQLVDVHLRFFGEEHTAMDPEITEAWTLWSGALEESDDPRRAWSITLYALMQDVRMATY